MADRDPADRAAALQVHGIGLRRMVFEHLLLSQKSTTVLLAKATVMATIARAITMTIIQQPLENGLHMTPDTIKVQKMQKMVLQNAIAMHPKS